MSIIEKVRAVEGVFRDVDLATASFQGHTGLYCKSGCARCCFKVDLEASALEFLPFAYYLYETGQIEEWLEKIRANESVYCVLLNPAPGVGACTSYPYRGLICRLFGYSARINKHGGRELVTCQVIKTEQAATYLTVQQAIAAGGVVPVMSYYYMQLHSIDADLARDFYPINQAIRRAIETVLHYYAYRV